MIQTLASSLSTALASDVYWSGNVDTADGLREFTALRDYPLGRQDHVMAETLPAFTRYGVAVHCKAATQTRAYALCEAAYQALLALNCDALSPPTSVGRDRSGRYEVVALAESVEAA